MIIEINPEYIPLIEKSRQQLEDTLDSIYNTFAFVDMSNVVFNVDNIGR